MTAPATDLPWNAFDVGELSRAATWYARLFDYVNRIRGAAEPMGLVWKANRAVGAAVSIPDNTWTKLPLDTMVTDTDAVGVAPGHFVAPAAGTYLFAGGMGVAGVGGLRQGCQVSSSTAANAFDGSPRLGARAAIQSDGFTSGVNVATLAAGATLALWAFQDGSGAARVTHTTAGLRPSLTVVRIR